MVVAWSLSPKPSCAGPLNQEPSAKPPARQGVPKSVFASKYFQTEFEATRMFVKAPGGFVTVMFTAAEVAVSPPASVATAVSA